MDIIKGFIESFGILSIYKVLDTVVVGELDSVLFQNVNLMPVIDE